MHTKKLYIILLFLLISFHCVNNYIWLSKDCLPGGVDTIPNLNDQSEFYNELTSISSSIRVREEGNNLLSQYSSLFSIPDPRTRFMYFVASVANILFGLSLFVTRTSNLIYYVILIIAVYFIGKRLMDKNIGLLAAFIVSIYPGICGMSRQFEHDFPTIAMVALCICLLLYTEGFKSKKYSLLFGVSLGLGILFRAQTLFFLIAPLGYISFKTFLKNRHREFVRVFNLIFSLSLAVLISSIWWRDNLRELLANFWDHVRVLYIPYVPSIRYVYDPIIQYWGYNIPYKFPTINWFFFYMFNTIAHISFFFFLVFIIGMFIFVKSNKIKGKSVIILWITIPYIIFTIISFKSGRFYFPSFPALALVSAAGILSLRRIIIKISLVILILCIGITQFFKLSYGLERLPYLSVKLPCTDDFWCYPPEVSNYNQVIDDFAEIINENASKNKNIRVGILTEWNPHIEYFLRLYIPNAQIFNILHGGNLPLNLDFLIVTGKANSNSPDYELIKRNFESWNVEEKKRLNGKELAEKEVKIKEGIVFVNKMVEEFKNYKVLKKALLIPAEQHIFLTTKLSLK